MGERKRSARAASPPSPPIPALPWAVATLGGLGRVPLMPGTAASLVGAVLCLPAPWLPWPVHVAGLVLVAAVAVWVSEVTARGLGQRDPSVIVIDEVAGMLAAATALPATLYDLAAVFLLFRLFDVVKPGPLEKLERLPGGWGIVLDDLAAGLLARAAWWLLQQNFDFL